jgi:hypothetical protein
MFECLLSLVVRHDLVVVTVHDHRRHVEIHDVTIVSIQVHDRVRSRGLPTGSQRPRYACALVWSCICLRVFEILLGTRHRE